MTEVGIYCLVDPITKLVRYVGRSVDIGHRYISHVNWKPRSRTRCASWIGSLAKRGLKPELHVFVECSEQELNDYEIFAIAMFRALGAPLTNHREGGQGGRPDAETRRKMSEAKKMRPPPSREHMLKMCAARQPLSADARRRISESKLGALHPFYGKPAVNRGVPHSDETKAKISAALKGKAKGRVMTEDARRRIGDAKRAWWAAKKAAKP